MSDGQLTYRVGGHGECDRCSECGDIPTNESISHHMETMHPSRSYVNAEPYDDERPSRTLAHVVADALRELGTRADTSTPNGSVLYETLYALHAEAQRMAEAP